MTPPADSRHFARSVLVILAVAVVLRVLWAIAVPAIPISDQVAYLTFAKNIAEHGVYGWNPAEPSAYWAVGTSAIFAALMKVFGTDAGLTAIVVMNVLMGTAIVALTIRLGRIFFSEREALLAGAFMAIWPGEVAYVTVAASELPFTLLILAGTIAWFSPGAGGLMRTLGGGLAFACATYVRPIALLMPVLYWLSALPNWRAMRAQLPTLILIFVVMAVVIAPWSVRNAKLFGHFVLVSTNGGANLWMGNNPQTDGFYMPLPASVDGLDEYTRDKTLGSEAMRYIVAEPASFVWRTIRKAVLLHANETISVHWNAEGLKLRFGEAVLLPLKLMMQAFWMVALAFALAGVAVLAYRCGIFAAALHPVVLTWAYFTAVYAITVVGDRYHFPSHPYMAMLMAVAAMAGLDWFRTKRRGDEKPPGAIAA